MKIVIFETEQWEAAACARLAGPHALACTPEPLRPDNVARFADQIAGYLREGQP